MGTWFVLFATICLHNKYGSTVLFPAKHKKIWFFFPQVYRGHTPHFCNFVQQVPLHRKVSNGTDISRLPDPNLDDVEFVMESAEGRLISRYRKNSNARWVTASHRGGYWVSCCFESFKNRNISFPSMVKGRTWWRTMVMGCSMHFVLFNHHSSSM